MSQPVSSSAFNLLRDQQYMNLFTYRKNGDYVKTPVWFAQEGERLYVLTVNNSGKIKRIRNNTRVDIGPCDRAGKPLGPTVEARARIMAPSDNAYADELLNQKYGLVKRGFDAVQTLQKAERVYLEIVPTNEYLGDSAA